MEMIVWLLLLSWAAWKDLRERRIPVWILGILGFFGFVLFTGDLPEMGMGRDMAGQVWRLLPGLFLLGVSLGTRGSLGLGDGWFFFVSAGFFSAEKLWGLLFGSLVISSIWGMGTFMKNLWEKDKKRGTIPFITCVWPVGVWMAWEQIKEKRDFLSLPASMTVEASYVMAVVLLSLMCLIGVAYDCCREYTAVMTMHDHVERLLGQTEEKETELSSGNWRGRVTRDKKQVTGRMEGDGWSKEIIVEIHEPEAFMRKAAAEEGLSALGGGDDG